jgi:hypothetical protein
LIGLDLGQESDPSALAVVEESVAWTWLGQPAGFGGTPQRLSSRTYAVRHPQRWRLQTPYPRIVQDVAGLLATPPLTRSRLVIDCTGVGRPVLDLFRQAGLACELSAVSFTAGGSVTAGRGWLNVPKRDLAAIMQLLLQEERLKVAPALELAGKLTQELRAFKAKVSARTGNETYEAWRERDGDDLVFAVAMPVWWAERRPAEAGRPYVLADELHPAAGPDD